jgi:hypothetical protein
MAEWSEDVLMNKEASLEDIAKAVGTLTVNPAVRSAALGTGAYFGSKWLYNKAADKMANKYFSQINDPAVKEKEWAAYTERKKKMQPWVTGTATAIGAGLPLMSAYGPYVAGKMSGMGTGSSLWNALTNNKFDALKNLPSFKTSMEKEADMYMSSDSPYGSPSADDITLGRTFNLPALRPMTFWDVPDIPKRQSIDLLHTQQPILGLDNTYALSTGMDQADDGRSGMISTGEIFQGLVRTGIGAYAGKKAAEILGTIFAQPAPVKDKMARYGMIGGAILNSGILTRLGR